MNNEMPDEIYVRPTHRDGKHFSCSLQSDTLKRTKYVRADKAAPVERIEGLAEAIDVLEAHMADMGDMAVVLVAARAYLKLQGGD